MLRILLASVFGLLVSLLSAESGWTDEPTRPNIVMVFIDDMGYADLGCYGNADVNTPRIDQLAADGRKFMQFTVASPICSPSRVGVTTGQYPARHRINSYLNNRRRNAERGMVDFLDPTVPTIARTFQNAGYATAHFGKWHMGGGRDVDDAPLPSAYGFDEHLVAFEGLGDRLLIDNPGQRRQAAALRRGNITWVQKHEKTPIYVDRSIDFITRHKDNPFYLHLWLNDVHDAFFPTQEQLAKYADFAENPYVQQYYAVIDAMDHDIGRLVDAIDELGLGESTLIVLCSDNGPTAWARYEREGYDAPGSTGGHRGRKWSLYEGGIREPFIVRWTGHIPAGREDRTTVINAVDLFPTFCNLAGIDADAALTEQGVEFSNSTPAAQSSRGASWTNAADYFDGVDMSQALLGNPIQRDQPLFWEYGRDSSYLKPALPIDRSPNLAVRDGQWKLLMNAEGSRVELYDLTDPWGEYDNRAGNFPEVRNDLIAKLTAWQESLPGYVEQTSQTELQKGKTLTLKSGQSRLSNRLPSVIDADIEVTATVTTGGHDGVIVAHGGTAAGYALYITEGRPHFTLRVRNEPTTITAPSKLPADRGATLTARIGVNKQLTLVVDGNVVAAAECPALLNTQPVDPLDVGRDTKGNVGDYEDDFAFKGTIEGVNVTIRAVQPKEVTGSLVTRWAREVEPDYPHQEYPRPQFRRDKWHNLNGRWQYAIRPKDEPMPKAWDGRITVPFPVESTLSGVKRRVSKDERLWYRRTFNVPEEWGNLIQLNFGGVDWETRVWVNGQEVVATPHRGGYDPFSYIISQQVIQHPDLRESQNAVNDGSRSTIYDVEHELVVSVWDPTSDGPQPRGKQLTTPRGIWYTPVTGIWQTVWIEPKGSIDALKITPDVDGSRILVDVTAGQIRKQPPSLPIRAVLKSEDQVVAEATGTTVRGEVRLELSVANSHLWSPDKPFLYDLDVSVDRENGDVVHSYVGMRKIELKKDDAGIDRLFLNDELLFQLGPLDQGWWPDGLYTAPTDQALRFDIQKTKEMGFNMIRKHVKVEPARWYFWADKLGILVWQDMPSGMDKSPGERGTSVPRSNRGGHVKKGEPDLDLNDEAKAIFRGELKAMIDALHNHPSIVVWVPFNEGWGQHDTNEILQWTKQFDPTRLVGGPSGWEDRGYGDLLDMHKYPGPDMFPATDGRASVLGEFGGLGLPVRGHTWVEKNNWGYRSYQTQQELQAAYEDLLRQLPSLIEQGLAAAVYTQTTDVEIEVNGLMTYDRSHLKFNPQELRNLHQQILE